MQHNKTSQFMVYFYKLETQWHCSASKLLQPIDYHNHPLAYMVYCSLIAIQHILNISHFGFLLPFVYFSDAFPLLPYPSPFLLCVHSKMIPNTNYLFRDLTFPTVFMVSNAHLLWSNCKINPAKSQKIPTMHVVLWLIFVLWLVCLHCSGPHPPSSYCLTTAALLITATTSHQLHIYVHDLSTLNFTRKQPASKLLHTMPNNSFGYY